MKKPRLDPRTVPKRRTLAIFAEHLRQWDCPERLWPKYPTTLRNAANIFVNMVLVTIAPWMEDRHCKFLSEIYESEVELTLPDAFSATEHLLYTALGVLEDKGSGEFSLKDDDIINYWPDMEGNMSIKDDDQVEGGEEGGEEGEESSKPAKKGFGKTKKESKSEKPQKFAAGKAAKPAVKEAAKPAKKEAKPAVKEATKPAKKEAKPAVRKSVGVKKGSVKWTDLNQSGHVKKVGDEPTDETGKKVFGLVKGVIKLSDFVAVVTKALRCPSGKAKSIIHRLVNREVLAVK